MIEKRFGHYEILDKVGSGGMGEVYRARDTRLDRIVALKMLPPDVAADPDRLARFEREAKTLAALNHPHVAAIYGIEHMDSQRCLVMEFADGEDLACRLARGPLSVADAIDAARQIASGLEEAHARGIVHRDLKPANIAVAADGTIKVLDFGLAKALSDEPAESAAGDAPTVAADRTLPGAILGTAGYMSPEQARGEPFDARTDIWAFGCVLYEMLTGKRLFAGKTVSDSIGAILHTEPDWTTLPASTPPRVRRLLRRCLSKNPKERLHHIADARLVLADQDDPPEVSTARPTSRVSRSAIAIVGVVGLAGLASAAAIFVGWQLRGGSESASEPPHRRFAIPVTELFAGDSGGSALSPDGARIAFMDDRGLRIRDLDALDDRPVPGGEEGLAPFWSPDGAWLAFGAEHRLWKVPATGGSPHLLCELPGTNPLTCGAWSDAGRIAISISGEGLFELSETGGRPTAIDVGDSTYATSIISLDYLPDGVSLLGVPHRIANVIAIRDGASDVLFDDETLHAHHAVFSPSGHLVYSRHYDAPGVWAVAVDPETLTFLDDPFLIVPDATSPTLADDGTLSCVVGSRDVVLELLWVDRDGTILQRIGTPALEIGRMSLSPDGTRVAYNARPNAGVPAEVYVVDLDVNTPVRLTFDDDWSQIPAWSPDGERIVYTARGIWLKPSDGSSEADSLFEGYSASFTPDGAHVVYTKSPDYDTWYTRSVDRTGEPKAVLTGPGRKWNAQVSPRGDYIAYSSNATGESEVYLARFPSGEGKWQVSAGGGSAPRWSADGTRLYFLGTSDGNAGGPAGERVPVVAKLHPGKSVRFDTPVPVFTAAAIDVLSPISFDASPDGERFVISRRDPTARDDPRIVVVQSWLASTIGRHP